MVLHGVRSVQQWHKGRTLKLLVRQFQRSLRRVICGTGHLIRRPSATKVTPVHKKIFRKISSALIFHSKSVLFDFEIEGFFRNAELVRRLSSVVVVFLQHTFDVPLFQFFK